jgi:hypothetical protein
VTSKNRSQERSLYRADLDYAFDYVGHY